MQSKVEKAVATLQSKFGRDRAGENMKRYAGQLLNDSLRDFDATLNFNKANDAGLTFIKYYGDIIPTTREICRNLVNGVYNKRKGGLFTIDEVRKLWTSRSWWEEVVQTPSNQVIYSTFMQIDYHNKILYIYIYPDII